MPAKREWVFVARGQLSDREEACQCFKLVGQRNHHADLIARQAVPGEARLVVIFDRVGDFAV
jgi:hypothetical protein